jgi:hypothetical protein
MSSVMFGDWCRASLWIAFTFAPDRTSCVTKYERSACTSTTRSVSSRQGIPAAPNSKRSQPAGLVLGRWREVEHERLRELASDLRSQVAPEVRNEREVRLGPVLRGAGADGERGSAFAFEVYVLQSKGLDLSDTESRLRCDPPYHRPRQTADAPVRMPATFLLVRVRPGSRQQAARRSPGPCAWDQPATACSLHAVPAEHILIFEPWACRRSAQNPGHLLRTGHQHVANNVALWLDTHRRPPMGTAGASRCIKFTASLFCRPGGCSRN